MIRDAIINSNGDLSFDETQLFCYQHKQESLVL